jgi:hypothetical protein
MQFDQLKTTRVHHAAQFLTCGDFVGQMPFSSCFFHAGRSDNDNHSAICYRETGSKSREAGLTE